VAEEAPVHVTIWSDVVCPFCNVARERADWLRAAGAEVEWLPYDLHPEYPPEGIPRADLMRRFPPGAEANVRHMNEEAGLAYNPHPETIPNTRRALELIEWGRAQGVGDALHERVMDAYWAEGRDVGGWDALEPLVAELGLDPAQAREEVDAGLFRDAVDASTRHAQASGINAVPAFVLDGRLLVSGAQPHEVFARALEQVAAMRAEGPAGG
jgi:predicted DsbA family dithiol-disulfide isomerase